MSKDAIRQAMPTVAAIVDEYRHLLGRVVYASENGQVIDRREPVSPEQVFDIPPGYCKPFELKGKK
jgi:hypothetical protein